MRTYRRLALLSLAALVVATLATNASAQTSDPIIGTWKLDVAKSTYKPGPAPKAATVSVKAGKGKETMVAVDITPAEGAPLKWSFTTMRDGADVPVTGNPAYDTAASLWKSPTEGVTTYKKGGKVVLTSNAEVSKDGKTLTLTSKGTDAKGQATNNVAVFTKQ
jgi:hypothetical protein